MLCSDTNCGGSVDRPDGIRKDGQPRKRSQGQQNIFFLNKGLISAPFEGDSTAPIDKHEPSAVESAARYLRIMRELWHQAAYALVAVH